MYPHSFNAMLRTTARAAICAAICALTLAVGIAQAADKTMIVFDASGSMWGQIDGKPKIDIAKNTLKQVIRNWNRQKPLGLMAYGHRSKGDCNDIEILVPIGNVNKQQFIQQIDALTPKGKTPVSQSLQRAAKALRHNEDKATIILISDGRETCDADPCDAAKALKKQGIDFVAHVVGFNVDKATDSQLACVAKATGGEYFSADDARSLNSALQSAVQTVQSPKPKTAGKAATAALTITASDKPNGKKLRANHSIYRVESGARRQVSDCQSTPQAACTESLSAGEYVVNSYYGEVSTSTPVRIIAGKAAGINAVLGTGRLTLSASAEKVGKAIEAQHSFRRLGINSTNGATQDINADCSSEAGKPCVRDLAPGQYAIHSRHGELDISTDFTIVAGQKHRLNVVMETGSLTLSASKGGKTIDAYHVFERVRSGGEAEDINADCPSEAGEPCTRRLAPGHYSIKSFYGEEDRTREEKSTPVTIRGGEQQRLDVRF